MSPNAGWDTIVVDVGCQPHENDSTAILIDRFKPNRYFGFDPLAAPAAYAVDDQTAVVISDEAAWRYDGEVSFREDGSGSSVGMSESGPTVPCFDFGAWLEPMLDHQVTVKLDCEGAEFALIDEMRRRSQLERLRLLLVEWHFPCPMEEWQF